MAASESVLNEGDAGYAPRGSGHYFINTNETHDAYVVLMFDDGEFTNVDITALTANVPAQVGVPMQEYCMHNSCAFLFAAKATFYGRHFCMHTLSSLLLACSQ